MNNRLIKSQVSYWRVTALLVLVVVLTVTSTRQQADTGICDGGAAVTIPFTDVPSGNIFFCSIAAAYFEGLTNGTTPTTYSPAAPVQRERIGAALSRNLYSSPPPARRPRGEAGRWPPLSREPLISRPGVAVRRGSLISGGSRKRRPFSPR